MPCIDWYNIIINDKFVIAWLADHLEILACFLPLYIYNLAEIKKNYDLTKMPLLALRHIWVIVPVYYFCGMHMV